MVSPNESKPTGIMANTANNIPINPSPAIRPEENSIPPSTFSFKVSLSNFFSCQGFLLEFHLP